MSLFSRNIRKISIISIILIVVFSFGSLFYINSISEGDIKDSLFEQQKQRQIESTNAVSKHIGSDLSLVMGMLDGLANSNYLQQGDLHSEKTKSLMEEKYLQFNTIINRLFILDKDDIVTISLAPRGSETFLAFDFSLRDWAKATKSTLSSQFSTGFERLGVYRIFITYPIINRDTGRYLGMLVTSIPTVPFFSHYGNIEHINSQFLVAYDTKGNILANGASSTLLGQNFFGDTTQQFINHNQILNNLTRDLLAGNPEYGVYDYGRGERLTTGATIFVQDKSTFFIQLVQPTAQIYSDIDKVLSAERTRMVLMLASTIVGIAALTVFLLKWSNTLDSEVRRRTQELSESNLKIQSVSSDLKRTNDSLIESNRLLAAANEQLKVHDKMQKEFIDIAAHELKNPIQPIIALSEILRSRRREGEEQEKEFLDVISRNGKRLLRVADDILDVAKIESQTLRLSKERFDLNEKIERIVKDLTQITSDEKKGVLLLYLDSKRPIFVEADEVMVFRVISNLLRNALKFTDKGTVLIKTEIKGDEVVVVIRDTGRGIDPEIFPRLFSKFATKSSTGGTGLGLFISKNIVEAHGGKIWAENNVGNGRGATFAFSLPLSVKSNIGMSYL